MDWFVGPNELRVDGQSAMALAAGARMKGRINAVFHKHSTRLWEGGRNLSSLRRANLSVAASRQSAANLWNLSQRRSAEAPLRHGKALRRAIALGQGGVKMEGVLQRMAMTSLPAAQAWASERPGRVAAKRKNMTL
jgi:hypothetical protein